MPTKRMFRAGLILALGIWGGAGLIRMAAHRHVAEDDGGSVGATIAQAVGR